MQYIFYISLILLAIIGISDLICYVQKCVYKPPNKIKVVLLPLSGNVEEIEYIIRKILARENLSLYSRTQIYIINQGIDKETLDIISIIQKSHAEIFVCHENELQTTIQANL